MVGITAANVAANAQELVEGVESMQVLYGEDTTDDQNPNRYVSANQVVNSANIVSVRIGLLLRSPNNTPDGQGDDSVLLDNITLEHSAGDEILRYAINSTIKLRNKGQGLVADLEPFTCDANTPGCDL